MELNILKDIPFFQTPDSILLEKEAYKNLSLREANYIDDSIETCSIIVKLPNKDWFSINVLIEDSDDLKKRICPNFNFMDPSSSDPTLTTFEAMIDAINKRYDIIENTKPRHITGYRVMHTSFDPNENPYNISIKPYTRDEIISFMKLGKSFSYTVIYIDDEK